MKRMNKTTPLLALAIMMAVLIISSSYVRAAPGGATIQSNTTAGVPVTTPGNRSDDARGTITTIVLNSIQQDQNWKAYVGNITGVLSLDDASGNTIYDWSLNSVSKIGEVYVSRSSSVVWGNISCVTVSNVTTEEVFHNMSPSQTDNINRTFNYTSHSAFFVGTTSISANSCKSTATYRNDSRAHNVIDGSQAFQEVVLSDSSHNVIFTTLVNGSYTGFDLQQYDFQIIVPESAIKALPTTYYFYTELSG